MLGQGERKTNASETMQVPAVYLPLFYPKGHDLYLPHRFKVLYGGAGSAKSESIARRHLSRLVAIPGYNLLVVRKTQRAGRTSTFPLFRRLIRTYGLSEHFSVNQTEMTITYRHNGNKIGFGGMKGEDERERLKSVTFESGVLEAVWMEEASEFVIEDFRQLNVRLRGNTGIDKEIVLSFNPITVDHWLKREFQIRDEGRRASTTRKNCWVLKTTVDDNPFVDEAYLEELEAFRESDPYYYDVYRWGRWGVISDNGVIVPYSLAYKAKFNEADAEGQFSVGCDPAGEGDDDATIYIRQGSRFLERRVFPKANGHILADAILDMIDTHRDDTDLHVWVKIDITGIGHSTFDILSKRGIQNGTVIPINFGGTAIKASKYCNCVTEMYFNAKAMLPEIQILSDDDEMISALTQRRYTVDEKTSRYIAEKKAVFKARTDAKVDYADAFVLCLYERGIGAKAEVGGAPSAANAYGGDYDDDMGDEDDFTPALGAEAA